jgi:hypothetical protein
VEFYTKAFFVALAALVLYGLVLVVQPFAASMAWAAFLAFLLYPLHRWLRRKLDGNMCRACPATAHLQTHHRRYDNKGRSFLAELRDCVTLCDSCHEAIHGKGHKHG